MKYILMIVMFVSCILVCYLLNKTRREREKVLLVLKNSASAHEMNKYLATTPSATDEYTQKLRTHVSALAEKKSTVVDVHSKILLDMPSIFNKNGDSSFLMKYLSAVIDTDSPKTRESIALRCEKMIDNTKNEMKTNMYISLAIGIVLIILVI